MKTKLPLVALLLVAGCSGEAGNTPARYQLPRAIVDLGTEITEQTPRRFWGSRMLDEMGFERGNRFEVVDWEYGPVSGSNSYFTLFNHGGPHVDAPNHIGVGPGIEAYPVETFIGPVKAFDLSHLDSGRTVTAGLLAGLPIEAGDIVILYTGYAAPEQDSELPATIALDYEAAEYLATLPVRAFGTDALSVASIADQSPVDADDPVARTVPAHFAFLSRGIPVYEQLVNVDRLLDEENMLFVGAPLKVRGGDGMLVRPVVLLY